MTTSDSEQLPPALRNGLPGEHHHRLDVLAGAWVVDKTTYIAGGTAESPVISHLTSTWRWLTGTGGRFIQEEAEGTLNGMPYYRMGVLGYANMDQRYEWTTTDSINAGMMAYQGHDGSDLSMTGRFTDPGVLGDAYVGKVIAMRTVFRLDTPDHPAIDLYFTPPGEEERLVDRVEYTRAR